MYSFYEYLQTATFPYERNLVVKKVSPISIFFQNIWLVK